jgi:hypothetical protein
MLPILLAATFLFAPLLHHHDTPAPPPHVADFTAETIINDGSFVSGYGAGYVLVIQDTDNNRPAVTVDTLGFFSISAGYTIDQAVELTARAIKPIPMADKHYTCILELSSRSTQDFNGLRFSWDICVNETDVSFTDLSPDAQETEYFHKLSARYAAILNFRPEDSIH